jgi:hypothetical protein
MGRDHEGRGGRSGATPRSGLRALAFSLVVVAVGVAACGSVAAAQAAGGLGRPGGTAAGSSVATTIPPGSASPKDAVRGYWDELAKDDFSAVCGYVLLSQRAYCRSALQDGSVSIAHPGVGDDFVDGTQALVAVLTTDACFGLGPTSTTTMCYSNTNPHFGLPKSDAGFAHAQQGAFNVESMLVACGELHGSWYVELEPVRAT